MNHWDGHKLAQERLELSAEYQTLSDQLGAILTRKPVKWLLIRQDTKSDTSAEREWQNTEDGIQETVLKLKLKALEKRMSGIKTYLDVLNAEARNDI